MDRTIDLRKDFIHFAELYVCFLKNLPIALKNHPSSYNNSKVKDIDLILLYNFIE